MNGGLVSSLFERQILGVAKQLKRGMAPYIIKAPLTHQCAHLPAVWCNVSSPTALYFSSFDFVWFDSLPCSEAICLYNDLIKCLVKAQSLCFSPTPLRLQNLQECWDKFAQELTPLKTNIPDGYMQSICCHKLCNNAAMRADLPHMYFHTVHNHVIQTAL